MERYRTSWSWDWKGGANLERASPPRGSSLRTQRIEQFGGLVLHSKDSTHEVCLRPGLERDDSCNKEELEEGQRRRLGHVDCFFEGEAFV
jgi:hypothetical protein